MFLCLITWQVYIKESPNAPEPTAIIVGKHNFDPGFQIGDEIFVAETIDDKVETIKCKVMDRSHTVSKNKNHIQRALGISLDQAKSIADDGGIIILRILAEPEDRDLAIKYGETLRIKY